MDSDKRFDVYKKAGSLTKLAGNITYEAARAVVDSDAAIFDPVYWPKYQIIRTGKAPDFLTPDEYRRRTMKFYYGTLC